MAMQRGRAIKDTKTPAVRFCLICIKIVILYLFILKLLFYNFII
jgi:hypothetical protein